MQMSEFRLQRVASVRFGPLALVALLVLAPAAAGAAEAAQSCRELAKPQDLEVVSSAAQIPDVYVARVNGGDAEHVTDLFADDAVHRGPDARIRKGRAAILEFYEGILASGPLEMAVGKSVADSGRVAFELINVEGCNEEDPATAVDLIDVNDANQIQDFTVFFRPDGN
jgi:ketosteroid isomerase-like protein